MAKAISVKTVRAIQTIATSKNFSEFNLQTDEYSMEDIMEANDQGKASDAMLSDVQAADMLLDLLFKMNDRQKIILMYQLLREAGYNLTHEDCAKTLNLTREHYIFLVTGVKKKSQKILQANSK